MSATDGSDSADRDDSTGRGRSTDRDTSRTSGGQYAGLTNPALVGAAFLMLSYLSVLYHVTDVVGLSTTMLLVVAGSIALATVFGRFLRTRTALVIGAVLIGGGLTIYFYSVPVSNRDLFTVGSVVGDTIGLLTGLSALRLTKAGVWALAIAPAPTFLTWYFVLRERYIASATIGGITLAFFVLTGDAGTLVTLLGVCGAVAMVGLGRLERRGRGAITAQFDTLAFVVAAIVVLGAMVSVVPGGAAQPLLPGNGAPTLESNVDGSTDSVSMQGAIRLSPKVRFTVKADQSTYWQTGVYDRYTGSGWTRSGRDSAYNGPLQKPPGETKTLVQQVTARQQLQTLPAAWRPIAIRGRISQSTEVSQQGGLVPRAALRNNESYTVRSEVPRYTVAQLRKSGTNYPDRVKSKYLQLPESTPDRVGKKADAIAGNEDNAYDKAVAIERYLKANKQYSLNVQKPDGNWADEFLFKMDAGYCTYFATTMVVLLREEGIPARFVTGYTPGQRVSKDKWVVRGLNAHAWVQVYFPDHGWVTFDPTPSTPRENAESARLVDARQNGEQGVDTADSQNGTWTTTTTAPQTTTSSGSTTTTTTTTTATTATTATNGSGNENRNPASHLSQRLGQGGAASGGTSGSNGSGNGTTTSHGLIPPIQPTRQNIGIGIALLIAFVAGIRRFGFAERVYRFFWLRYHGGKRSPESDVERSFERLEYLLGRRYRPRRTTETPRAYLRALANVGVDEQVRSVGQVYERAHYGGEVSRSDADDAIATVDRYVRSHTPIVGRFRS